jgi:hypothetical protein
MVLAVLCFTNVVCDNAAKFAQVTTVLAAKLARLLALIEINMHGH